VGPCFLGVGGEGFVFRAAPHPLAGARGRPFGRSPALRAAVGIEVQVALDGKAERTAEVAQFVHADEANLLGPSMALTLRARLRRFKTAPAVLVRASQAERPYMKESRRPSGRRRRARQETMRPCSRASSA